MLWLHGLSLDYGSENNLRVVEMSSFIYYLFSVVYVTIGKKIDAITIK